MSGPTIIYDIETYLNCFTLAAEHADYPIKWAFEISDWRDDSREIIEWLSWINNSGGRLCGFNNVGFDYPVLHTLIKMGKASALTLYEKAKAIIDSQNQGGNERFSHMVYPSDRMVPQIDLFKIHHFDNNARATSLKALEFNMRMDNISDLPFKVGSVLNRDQIETLKAYNAHDVHATKLFYHQSLEQIRFREELTKKHGRDFMNHSDVKIGKEVFQMELEKSGVSCYKYGPNGREPSQTKRASIALRDCIPSWVAFQHPEFQRIHKWFSEQVIVETKGAFEDVTARVGGLDFYFGTGGIHASVDNQNFIADDEWMILDIDVTSLYPSIAIANRYYPEHLGETFVHVYERLKEQRVSFKKGTPENAMLKLALNGVYGASGDKFSIFYDPLFTMRITIGGQLMLAMLAERLSVIENVNLIQTNTDGITMYLRREQYAQVKQVCSEWETLTKLSLEEVEYSKMFIRDVNNYICEYVKGGTKRKGAYEHKLEWHKNGSCLIIPKVAEQVLIYGKPLRETVENWPDKMDFMCRVKVPRSSSLVGTLDGVDYPMENTQRYYVSKGGYRFFKIMPPLAKKPNEWRRIGVESGWTVCPCNKIEDAVLPIDYEYYVKEIEKLCLPLL